MKIASLLTERCHARPGSANKNASFIPTLDSLKHSIILGLAVNTINVPCNKNMGLKINFNAPNQSHLILVSDELYS